MKINSIDCINHISHPPNPYDRNNEVISSQNNNSNNRFCQVNHYGLYYFISLFILFLFISFYIYLIFYLNPFKQVIINIF
ncbi:hypothetical protein A0H76_2186 [Hepatospora eriocheir]|uniref:Uncharacterized protein n=1 Tax=Hepatospora eriocheir TaxID=1081669 RepID=A0A1X0QLC3_9MICR|nr:hypothetical protein A0H76_2186 [Hepatospora eriocheir]